MSQEFDKFVDIVSELRGPNGCAWDKKHTLYTLKDDFIGEAYEVVDAIENEDNNGIREELGDVLLHIVLHAQIAKEYGLFTIDDVIKDISEKIVRRHPHVFGNEKTTDTDVILKRWEEIKQQEKGNKKARFLDKAAKPAPTILQSEKIQKTVAKIGFDWKKTEHVLEKLYEEIDELKNAINSHDKDNISEEIGDLFFTLINLARHYGIDSEKTLQNTNKKFIQRFSYIEDAAESRGIKLEDMSQEEMELLWEKSKKRGH